MHRIPEVPEVTLPSLVDAILTTVPPDKLDSVCERLISSGAIQNPDKKKPRWKSLQHSLQSDKPGVFSVIETIVLAVNDSPSKKFASDLKLKVAQESMPLDSRHDSSPPDGFFYPKQCQQRSSKVSWTDVVMPMECHSTGEELDKIRDYAKIMWSMHRVMSNDARRRFVHGLTCENTKARLWYHDRCDVVASEEFDINKGWKHLVRIVLSTLLAPPDRLGFDPDVELLPCDNPSAKPSYDITIYNSDTEKPTTYRTLKVLYDVGVDRMTGPGTRVWIVRKLVDGELIGPSCVLKDAWVDQDRVTEHVMLQHIRKAQPSYAQYFLTPIDYGLAYFSVAAPDNTHKTLRRVELITTSYVLITNPSTTLDKSRMHMDYPTVYPEYPGHTMPTLRQKGYRDFRRLSEHALQHYRIVVEEIGRPVHDLRDWTEIFTAIQGGWEGLHAINLCGYVHRDVSSGNILLVPASGSLGQRGVIMDLEYAKDIDDTSLPHEVKTGTAAFMATEVASNEHHRLLDLRYWQAKLDAHQNQSSLRLKDKYQWKLPPFRHNPLHDMESIWWLCVWMMFRLVPAGQDADEHSDNYYEIFYNQRSQCRRKDFICKSLVFYNRTAHLQEFAPFVSIMETWSTALNEHYCSSYEKHDTSNNHLKNIRVESDVIQASYKHGRAFLQQLEEASRSLSTPPVAFLEQSNDRSFTTCAGDSTALPLMKTGTTKQSTVRPYTKTTKRPRGGSFPRTIKRCKASFSKLTQDERIRAGLTQRRERLFVADTSGRFSVSVELPVCKKARRA
ncbi:kinase domain protein, partial [Rhizoctonia solani AG-3 Rhs1AP]